MPSKTDKQKKFFYEVLSCKKDGVCKSAAIKNAATSMTLKQIIDFTHKNKKNK